VVGRRDVGLVPAIGGLVGTVIDTGGPYVVRVKRVVTAAVFGGVAGLVIGMFIHHRGWVAVASLVVVAGVSALISRQLTAALYVVADAIDAGVPPRVGELPDDEALKPLTDAVRPVLSVLGSGPQPARPGAAVT
jgi:hypothetical protein